MDENSLGLKCSFLIIHVFSTTTKTRLKSIFFTVLAMKNLMNLASREFGKRLTTVFTIIKCHIPLRNNNMHFCEYFYVY